MANRLLKLPANCYLEFFKLIKELQDTPKNITAATLIFRGNKDFIVPQESVEHVYNEIQNPHKKIVLLDKTTHDVFREKLKEEATDIIIGFFKNTIRIEMLNDLIKDAYTDE